MIDQTLPKQYVKNDVDRLTDAVHQLRSAPAFKVFEKCLTDLLEQRKTELVTNQSALVPNLQGRAIQLMDILAILNRKND